MPEVLTKICSKCHTAKPVEKFCKASGRPDGLQVYCKDCEARGAKTRRKKNKARENVIIPDFKTCVECGIEKPGSDFYKNNHTKNILQIVCKDCSLILDRKRRYGASPEWQKATLKAQGGACAICKFIPGPKDRALHLDHKHPKGLRGFLHGKCNRGIGYFKDSVELIGKAIEYLSGPTTGIVYKKTWSHGNGVPVTIREQILASQNYLCKICSVSLTTKTAHIDHDHLTMIIRGALCGNCNPGLGQFDDSVILLTNAIAYLNKYSSQIEPSSEVSYLVALEAPLALLQDYALSEGLDREHGDVALLPGLTFPA